MSSVPRNVKLVFLHVGKVTYRPAQRRQHLLENLTGRQHFFRNAEGPTLAPRRHTQPDCYQAPRVCLRQQHRVHHLREMIFPSLQVMLEDEPGAMRVPAAKQSCVPILWLQDRLRRLAGVPPNATIEMALPEFQKNFRLEEQPRVHQVRAYLAKLCPARWRSASATIGSRRSVSSLSVLPLSCTRTQAGCGRRALHSAAGVEQTTRRNETAMN